VATNLIEEFGPTLKLAHDYIKNSQVHIQHAFSSIWFNVRFIYSTDDKAIYYERFVMTALEIWMTGTATHLKVLGPFSTADHGWPISDCTAEALKVS